MVQDFFHPLLHSGLVKSGLEGPEEESLLTARALKKVHSKSRYGGLPA